jgi:hypothetical protein
MQFPAIPPQKVTPVVRRDVTGVAPVTPVSGAPPQVVPGSPRVASTGEPPVEATPPFERRQASRRDPPDRRRRQVPVLLDTRTGRDRRGERRRADDPMPARVNESA